MNYVQNILDLWSAGHRKDAANDLCSLTGKDLPDDVVIEVLDAAVEEDDPNIIDRFVSGS